jgi:hypothetical protein
MSLRGIEPGGRTYDPSLYDPEKTAIPQPDVTDARKVLQPRSDGRARAPSELAITFSANPSDGAAARVFIELLIGQAASLASLVGQLVRGKRALTAAQKVLTQLRNDLPTAEKVLSRYEALSGDPDFSGNTSGMFALCFLEAAQDLSTGLNDARARGGRSAKTINTAAGKKTADSPLSKIVTEFDEGASVGLESALHVLGVELWQRVAAGMVAAARNDLSNLPTNGVTGTHTLASLDDLVDFVKALSPSLPWARLDHNHVDKFRAELDLLSEAIGVTRRTHPEAQGVFQTYADLVDLIRPLAGMFGAFRPCSVEVYEAQVPGAVSTEFLSEAAGNLASRLPLSDLQRPGVTLEVLCGLSGKHYPPVPAMQELMVAIERNAIIPREVFLANANEEGSPHEPVRRWTIHETCTSEACPLALERLALNGVRDGTVQIEEDLSDEALLQMVIGLLLHHPESLLVSAKVLTRTEGDTEPRTRLTISRKEAGVKLVLHPGSVPLRDSGLIDALVKAFGANTRVSALTVAGQAKLSRDTDGRTKFEPIGTHVRAKTSGKRAGLEVAVALSGMAPFLRPTLLEKIQSAFSNPSESDLQAIEAIVDGAFRQVIDGKLDELRPFKFGQEAWDRSVQGMIDFCSAPQRRELFCRVFTAIANRSSSNRTPRQLGDLALEANAFELFRIFQPEVPNETRTRCLELIDRNFHPESNRIPGIGAVVGIFTGLFPILEPADYVRAGSRAEATQLEELARQLAMRPNGADSSYQIFEIFVVDKDRTLGNRNRVSADLLVSKIDSAGTQRVLVEIKKVDLPRMLEASPGQDAVSKGVAQLLGGVRGVPSREVVGGILILDVGLGIDGEREMVENLVLSAQSRHSNNPLLLTVVLRHTPGGGRPDGILRLGEAWRDGYELGHILPLR